MTHAHIARFVTLLWLVTVASLARGDDTVVGLDAFAPCCGRCAYLNGCTDDPRDEGACCVEPSYRNFPRSQDDDRENAHDKRPPREGQRQ
jgi:hypothetical protein